MSDFKVSIKNLASAADSISALEKAVSTSADAVKSVKSNLALQIRSAQRISSRLTSAGSALDAHRSALRRVAEAGGKAAEIYEQNEKKLVPMEDMQSSINNSESGQLLSPLLDVSIINILPLIKEIASLLIPPESDDYDEYEIDSVVFDDEGSYGGDQGSPKSKLSWFGWLWNSPSKEEKEYCDILRQYEPYSTYSDKKLRAVIKKLNDEGCGYVAVINTIFAAFEGREEEFEKTFGFPMYKDGDLNFNHLLVDFYAATDNKDWDGEYSEDADDGTNHGTLGDRAHLYLDEKGVNVDVTAQMKDKLTPDNFEEYSKDKYVIINFYNGNIRDENGKVIQYIKGGHAMVVTGVTSDGRYIVSSWGRKCYIDPNEKVNKETDFMFSCYQYDLGEG